MLVSLSWLKEFVPLELSPHEIAEVLTMAGLEVDKVKDTPLKFSGVVCGEVLGTSPHPNADKLTVAQVTDGKEGFQVVCGASNCKTGVKVAFAKIGAKIDLEDGKKLKIKKGKLRDVESFGMLCSEEELGFAESSDRIMHLPSDTPLGIDLTKLYSDTLFEISLTPNLGHCMSMLGIARELAAKLDLKVTIPSVSLKEDSGTSIDSKIKVTIKDPENCPRYTCRLVEGVTIGTSPAWLSSRLEAAGIRSINNIVDISNYVMLELGQPLHAFDYDKIQGKEIIVDSSEKELTMTTLDDEERTVPKGSLLIYDKSSPIAVAGVMGGKGSSTEDSTKNILIESAFFSPQSVRRGSKKLGLRSESSSRFEKGIDYERVTHALDRAAQLMQQVAGGKIVSGMIDEKPAAYEERKLTIRALRTSQILGTSLSLGEIESFLNALSFTTLNQTEGSIEVAIPSYRNDVQGEIDLIEEVARIYGYNNIAQSTPRYATSTLPHDPIFLLENEVRKRCIGAGLQEFLTCDLISPKLSQIGLEASMSSSALIEVMHPSSVDQSILRSSLLPGLLASIKLNQDHKQENISAFEVGRIHFKDDTQFIERSNVAILLTGKTRPHHYESKPKQVDFYDLKGIVENLLESLNLASFTLQASTLTSFHPSKQMTLHSDGQLLGVIGEVHPEHLLTLDLKERVFFAQLDLHDLLSAKKRSTQMTPLPQFPESERDWTISLKKDFSLGAFYEALESFLSKLLKNTTLLDIYESDKIGADRKNVTFRFTYRDDKKTIEYDKVEKEHQRLQQTILNSLKDSALTN